MRIPEQRYRCPLGQLQGEARMDPEAIKREGWRDQRILVVSDADDRLDCALHLLDRDDLAGTANAAADLDGREKTQAVSTNIHGVGKTSHLDQLRQEVVDQTHGEIAVRNRAPERPGPGALGINMNPLMIARDICKAVDALLVNVQPFGGTQDRSLAAKQVAGCFENPGHACWLETETISPVM